MAEIVLTDAETLAAIAIERTYEDAVAVAREAFEAAAAAAQAARNDAMKILLARGGPAPKDYSVNLVRRSALCQFPAGVNP